MVYLSDSLFKSSYNAQRVFSLRLRLSSCAWLLNMVISNSPVLSIVSMFSFSKTMRICRSLSSRIILRKSTVFLANQLMDLVRIISILPSKQSAINIYQLLIHYRNVINVINVITENLNIKIRYYE